MRFLKALISSDVTILLTMAMMPEDKYELELDEDFNKNNLAPVYSIHNYVTSRIVLHPL